MEREMNGSMKPKMLWILSLNESLPRILMEAYKYDKLQENKKAVKSERTWVATTEKMKMKMREVHAVETSMREEGRGAHGPNIFGPTRSVKGLGPFK